MRSGRPSYTVRVICSETNTIIQILCFRGVRKKDDSLPGRNTDNIEIKLGFYSGLRESYNEKLGCAGRKNISAGRRS